MRKRSGLALLAAGVAGVGALVPGEARSQSTDITSTVVPTVEGTDLATTITVHGEAQLKDGMKLVVILLHKTAKVEERITTVGAQQYTVKFGPWKKIIFPGSYDAQIVLTPKVQKEDFKREVEGYRLTSDKATFNIGSAADVAYREYTVKAKMIDVLENLRLSYLDLAQAATYYRAELQTLNLNSRIADLPEDKHLEHVKRYARRKAEIFPVWQEIAGAEWDDRVKTTRYDWKTFHDQIVVSPFPEVDGKIDELFQTYERWYRGVSGQIYPLCGQAVPPELEQKEVVSDPFKLGPQLQALALACYKGLGYPAGPEWKLSDLSQPEKGELKDGVWRSYVSKFEIREPEGWLFYPGGNKPSIRLSFKPPEAKDPKAASRTIVVVEILDFAIAENMKHLAQLARELNRNRWKGAHEVKTENINAPDRTMPGTGLRPGIDSEFVIDDAKHKLHCRYYQLFCRWHKRTYGVLCISPEDEWASREEVFRKACASYKVLDAPEFKELKEQEKRDEINKEGRDPGKAILDAQKFGGGDAPKAQDPPKDPPK